MGRARVGWLLGVSVMVDIGFSWCWFPVGRPAYLQHTRSARSRPSGWAQTWEALAARLVRPARVLAHPAEVGTRRPSARTCAAAPRIDRVMIRQRLARFIVRRAGYRMVGEVPDTGILVGAPHTSNWDFVTMLLVMWHDGAHPRVLVKKQLFRGPLGWLLRRFGGVPLDRDNAAGVVGELVAGGPQR